MTTYAQTTIHSKIAKYFSINSRYEKTSGDGTMGRVVKGTLSHFGKKIVEENDPPKEIMR